MATDSSTADRDRETLEWLEDMVQGEEESDHTRLEEYRAGGIPRHALTLARKGARLEREIRTFFERRYPDLPLVNVAVGGLAHEQRLALAALDMEPHEAMAAYRAAPPEGEEGDHG